MILIRRIKSKEIINAALSRCNGASQWSLCKNGDVGEPWVFGGFGNTVNLTYLISVAWGHSEAQGSASAIPAALGLSVLDVTSQEDCSFMVATLNI